MTQTALHTEILAFSMELSNDKWVLTFGNFDHGPRVMEVGAGDFRGVGNAVASTCVRWKLPADTRVVSCYEAGRDGFWIHRELLKLKVDNLVVDSASIEISRRRKRKKNDKLDGRKLLEMLLRHLRGETKIWSVVRVPSADEEDQRRRSRELERLKHERTQHLARIRALLVLEGVRIGGITAKFADLLETMKRQDGTPLGAHLKAELLREHRRLRLAEEQIKGIDKALAEEVKDEANPSEAAKQVRSLSQLKGLAASAWVLVLEFFAWRNFKNRREVGALAGLDGSPYDSGDSQREQGISKAGNRRVRALMVELAWCWVRYQPRSALTQWFLNFTSNGNKRNRRVGIVALARKLLVALWKYLKTGEVPKGAEFKPA